VLVLISALVEGIAQYITPALALMDTLGRTARYVSLQVWDVYAAMMGATKCYM
jgi:hypothetical protein